MARLRSLLIELVVVFCIINTVLSATSNDSASRRTSNGQCIWYGACYEDPNTGTTKNCYYDGPPKKLVDEEAIAILKKRCPDLSPEATCCGPDQVGSTSLYLCYLVYVYSYLRLF
uniref:Uncharacterized protein LOC114340684 n=1 Tax=Diabrotica virgifera virgifera TaxID=50390 RepID=A0A6P7GCX0_DIAVI